MNQEVDLKNLAHRCKVMEEEKLQHLQEIQLLKDYTYGVDTRAKDVHMHKFIKGASKKGRDHTDSRNDISSGFTNDFSHGSVGSLKPSNCQSCGAFSVCNQSMANGGPKG